MAHFMQDLAMSVQRAWLGFHAENMVVQCPQP